jgi:hypothetical protein
VAHLRHEALEELMAGSLGSLPARRRLNSIFRARVPSVAVQITWAVLPASLPDHEDAVFVERDARIESFGKPR